MFGRVRIDQRVGGELIQTWYKKSKFWYGSTECPWVRNDWIAGQRGYDWETLHVLPQVSHSFAAQRIKAHTKPRGAQKKLGLGPFERETVVSRKKFRLFTKYNNYTTTPWVYLTTFSLLCTEHLWRVSSSKQLIKL